MKKLHSSFAVEETPLSSSWATGSAHLKRKITTLRAVTQALMPWMQDHCDCEKSKSEKLEDNKMVTKKISSGYDVIK